MSTNPAGMGSGEPSTYTLDHVCDAYNDLLDLKSYAVVLQKSDFPDRLLPPIPPPCLGTVLVDIAADGSVSSCTFEASVGVLRPPPHSSCYAWINIERPTWPSPLHSNCLLWSRGEVWRFEPHGSDPSLPEQAACGFRGFYNAADLDRAVSGALRSAGLLESVVYRGVDARWPLLGQSISTNNGPLNSRPLLPGRALKRTGAVDGTGDNFCGMWTLLYIVRALATSPDVAMEQLACRGVGEGEAAGAVAADLIATFTLSAHATYKEDIARMHADAEWAAMEG
jgi:hypothetical protein